MRCGDQQTPVHTNPPFTCGLVQTSNTKARPQESHLRAEGALPRPSATPKVKLAGYKGERLRRARG